jgi:hypothetical protein
MADNSKTIISKSDDELMEWLASELQNRYMQGSESGTKLAETVLTMRASTNSLSAAKEVSKYTRELAISTKNLAIGTWAIATITLITQVTFLILTLKK